MSVLLGNGDGTFGAQTTFAVGSAPRLGDDGGRERRRPCRSHHRELASATTVSVLLGNGDGTFGAQTTFAVGSGPISVTAADVNGDGHADLIAANYD